MEVVEAVLDLLGVDVEGDYARNAQVFEHLPNARRGKPFAAFALMLPAVGIGGQHEVHVIRPGLNRGIDGDEEGKDVIVDREVAVDRPVVEGYRLMVLDILEDVQILAPDRIEDLGLDLPVGEIGMPRITLNRGGRSDSRCPGI